MSEQQERNLEEIKYFVDQEATRIVHLDLDMVEEGKNLFELVMALDHPLEDEYGNKLTSGLLKTAVERSVTFAGVFRSKTLRGYLMNVDDWNTPFKDTDLHRIIKDRVWASVVIDGTRYIFSISNFGKNNPMPEIAEEEE